MTLTSALAGLLVLTVGIAVVRLVLRHFRTPAGARARPWRLAVLLALQPLSAGLLYLTLMPPPSSTPTGTLVVATRHAPVAAAIATSERAVALPEAPALPGVERVPDLATALRRDGVTRLRLIGEGLAARDRDAARGMAIDFAPPPLPAGLVRLDPPRAVAAGAAFCVGGRVNGVAEATVELIDPAGRRVDVAVPDAAGDFVVDGTARAAGPASFTLRVKAGPRLVETAEVPVWTAADPPPRVLLLAGAPGPEVKYLRRWASDAGLALHSQFATGAGLELGDAPLPLTTATLKTFDVAVLDERSWAALPPGARAAVIDAVRDGLGLIVRITGPLSAPARAALLPLGFAVSGGAETAPVVLAGPSEDAAAQTARAGPGTSDDPASTNRGDAPPALTRWTVKVAAPAATALLRDARGGPVALWRAEGRGRIALWPLADSYALVLAGRGGRYGELWSSAFATVGRGRPGVAPAISDARVGERVALCGLAGDAVVVGPDGRTTKLLVDPAAGAAACAAFWPSGPGWHQLQQRGVVPSPFFVAAAAALPGVRAMADRDATLALAATATGPRSAVGTATRPGRSWPWFLAWLVASAALWWFERARFGRGDSPAP